MKLEHALLSVLLLTVLCFTQCNKEDLDENGLPPATQEGKNTLGFLLNGQPWTPKGFNGTANLSLYYDASYSGGVFNIAAFRSTSSSNGSRQSLHLYGDSMQAPQKILLPNRDKFGFSFWDESIGCTYSTSDSSTILLGGYFDLQKLDKAKGIFSGEFELHFRKKGCAEAQIKQGRFDLRF